MRPDGPQPARDGAPPGDLTSCPYSDVVREGSLTVLSPSLIGLWINSNGRVSGVDVSDFETHWAGGLPTRVGSACRRFHRAELGEQRQVVTQPPQFGDLAVFDADEGYVGELNRLSGRRCAGEGAGMGPP